LYVLYEGYNFNVATLYASGFVMGAISSPLVGPIVDNFGRRKAAMMYCFLEMIINTLEQYECLTGVIAARLIGGITTNLLFTVFEAWLITEHRQRNFPEEKLEIVLRDTVISSNLSAIASGFIAHKLAETFGAQGPFKGAVACTSLALLLVGTKWEENYGGSIHKGDILRTMSECTT
jgi:MFS transporter, MFS domain-containing protein family, molybdate-anion transporter